MMVLVVNFFVFSEIIKVFEIIIFRKSSSEIYFTQFVKIITVE